MALTRARPVSGDATLAAELQTEIAAILAASRKSGEVKAAAVEMRDLLEQEKPARDAWDLKLVPGGLIDLEFIAQVASLTGAVQAGPDHETSTAAVLAQLDPDFADAGAVETLASAHQLYTAVTQVIRLCVVGDFDKTDMPPALADILLRATDTPELSVLDALLVDTQHNARTIFDRLLRRK